MKLVNQCCQKRIEMDSSLWGTLCTYIAICGRTFRGSKHSMEIRKLSILNIRRSLQPLGHPHRRRVGSTYLSAPAVHLLVVRANIPEIRARDGKQSAGHCWRIGGTNVGHGATFLFQSTLFLRRHIDPVKVAVPREPTDLQSAFQ